jgi:hypothetical protein
MKKKEKNKLITLFFIVNFLFCATGSYSENFIKKHTYKIIKADKIKISKKNMERINGYLNGNFYSQNLNKNFIHVSGIYYAISKDGNSSSISFCDADHFTLCAEQMLAYQTLKKCEKISKQECFLIFRGKTFLPTRENNLDLGKYFIANSKANGLHLDIYGKTLEEFHQPED